MDDDRHIRLGELNIMLPAAGERRCWIMHDLAGLFGLEYNADALDRLERAWKDSAHSRRLDVDHEADYVFVYAGRDAIVDAAVLIHALAEPPRALDPDEIERVRDAVKRYRRPTPAAWRVGDVFGAPLVDGRMCFGQVLYERDFAAGAGVRAPTCALLEHTGSPLATLQDGALEEVLSARTVAILHVSSTHLDEGRWKVVGWHEPVCDPFAGPCGTPSTIGAVSWDGLEVLANAYWGLAPWNAFYRDDYLERYLMPGIERPSRAVMLDTAELAARGIQRR